MFTTKILILLLGKKMWPKVTAFAVLAVFTAFLSIFISPFIPDSITYKVGADTVGSILTILASSMLAVTTFSLSTMVSAYSSASSGATPRATQLLQQDSTTQNALATFLGSFLFSLAGIICINTGVYDGSGRFILFVSSLGVICLIVIMLIRWIEHLTQLGRIGATTRQVEKVAAEALRKRAKSPYFGANPLSAIPQDILKPEHALFQERYGYVQYLNAAKLSELADKHALHIYLKALPGCCVGPAVPLCYANREIPPEAEPLLRTAFIIGDQRSFEQDPRFGICVLAEIAVRALSQAVNDPGTVIDVIGRLERTLPIFAGVQEASPWRHAAKIRHRRSEEKKKNKDTGVQGARDGSISLKTALSAKGGRGGPLRRKKRSGKEDGLLVRFPNLWIPGLKTDDLFEDAFCTITRDGAGLYEIQTRLQKALASLHAIKDHTFRESALKYARIALERAAPKLDRPEELAHLKEISPARFAE